MFCHFLSLSRFHYDKHTLIETHILRIDLNDRISQTYRCHVCTTHTKCYKNCNVNKFRTVVEWMMSLRLSYSHVKHFKVHRICVFRHLLFECMLFSMGISLWHSQHKNNTTQNIKKTRTTFMCSDVAGHLEYFVLTLISITWNCVFCAVTNIGQSGLLTAFEHYRRLNCLLYDFTMLRNFIMRKIKSIQIKLKFSIFSPKIWFH